MHSGSTLWYDTSTRCTSEWIEDSFAAMGDAMKSGATLIFTCLLALTPHGLTAAAPRESPESSLAARMDQAWEVSWGRFFHPGTKLFYDYLSSYEPGRELAHLPTADEVARQYPNPLLP
jgi:hypothetical protein